MSEITPMCDPRAAHLDSLRAGRVVNTPKPIETHREFALPNFKQRPLYQAIRIAMGMDLLREQNPALLSRLMVQKALQS